MVLRGKDYTIVAFATIIQMFLGVLLWNNTTMFSEFRLVFILTVVGFAGIGYDRVSGIRKEKKKKKKSKRRGY